MKIRTLVKGEVGKLETEFSNNELSYDYLTALAGAMLPEGPQMRLAIASANIKVLTGKDVTDLLRRKFLAVFRKRLHNWEGISTEGNPHTLRDKHYINVIFRPDRTIRPITCNTDGCLYTYYTQGDTVMIINTYNKKIHIQEGCDSIVAPRYLPEGDALIQEYMNAFTYGVNNSEHLKEFLNV